MLMSLQCLLDAVFQSQELTKICECPQTCKALIYQSFNSLQGSVNILLVVQLRNLVLPI